MRPHTHRSDLHGLLVVAPPYTVRSQLIALLGRVLGARRALAVSAAARSAVEGRRATVFLRHVEAILHVAEGDDELAGAAMREALDGWAADEALFDVLRAVLGISYVLLPERRAELDGAALGPDGMEALISARALLAARDGRKNVARVVTPGRVLASLGLVWSIEFAVLIGDEELARFLLDGCGEPARSALHRLADEGNRVERDGARRLLRELPSAPRERFVADDATQMLERRILGLASTKR